MFNENDPMHRANMYLAAEALRERQAKIEQAQAAQAKHFAEREKAARETEIALAESAAKATALAAWTGAGGAERDFESAWPKLRKTQLERAALEGPTAQAALIAKKRASGLYSM